MRAVVLCAVGLLGMPLLAADSQQGPGDRPAANPRATRSVVLARNGVIATSQPLASAAGLRVLQQGGNAIDAAITAAAVLAVVEPTMNGVGGDLFALVYDAKTKSVHALNASGRAPQRATPEEFKRRGLEAIPYRGELSVSVPGVVDGWSELLTRYGTITMDRALEPAIGYARDGYAVSEIIADQWKDVEALLARDPAAAATFLPGGHSPAAGDVFRNPQLAATLEQIAKGGRDAFYKGPIAKAIAADMQRRNALLTEADLAANKPTGSSRFRPTTAATTSSSCRRTRRASSRSRCSTSSRGSTSSRCGTTPPSTCTCWSKPSESRLPIATRGWPTPTRSRETRCSGCCRRTMPRQRRREINPEHAAEAYKPLSLPGSSQVPEEHPQAHGDTIYMTVADREGNVVSLIQSLFEAFGSGIVAGDTGIALHNRGALFTLQAGHPNLIAPGKRPFHTLVPAMVMKDNRPWLSFGVMGGDMQPQGHVQVLLNLIDFGMNIQEAGEAPRFRHSASGLALESAISPEARFGLVRRGHSIVTQIGMFGGFQGILFDQPRGVMMAGSDPRKDGLAIGF